MTERKTTEIKIRVTPSFKARVQGAADAAGVSLTEWLETASEEKISFAPNALAAAITAAIETQENPTPAWTIETHPARSWMYEAKIG